MSSQSATLSVTEKASVPDWNAFVLKHGQRSGAFLQSWEWGDVLEEDGYTVVRNLCDEIRSERAQALSDLMRLPFGQRYFYIPRGPVGATPEIEARMLKALTHATHTQQSRPLFFRVDAARQLPTSHFQ